MENIKEFIVQGKACLGIELGSTRIKAVLIGEDYLPIASGSYDWENRLENGVWTYHLEDVWEGLQEAFKILANNVEKNYHCSITVLRSMGISAMMHGFLPFDSQDNLLTPFRTWRNTTTQVAASQLTDLFSFNIPQRWSIAHLYQAMLNQEPYINQISFFTTLAGYVHWKLTGQKVLGIGDASGMFPIDSSTKNYIQSMIEQFDAKSNQLGYSLKLEQILPKVLCAGENTSFLSAEGARLLDPTGILQAGALLCPPEGDAGTGMVATNSVTPKTGNVSAGTSIFSMVVLEKPLSKRYRQIDMVTTPSGNPVAMVHCNNCTSDFDAWVAMFSELLNKMFGKVSKPELYDFIYNIALTGDADAGGLLSYNYLSGEHNTDMEEGRPLFTRLPSSELNLGNFSRSLLYATMCTLRIGMNVLTEQEYVRLEQMMGHGGLFKTEMVGQRLMAGALQVPVTVLESAGEGGAWGIALLAAYAASPTTSLEDFVTNEVFSLIHGITFEPLQEDCDGFNRYLERYQQGLAIERAAVDNLK